MLGPCLLERAIEPDKAGEKAIAHPASDSFEAARNGGAMVSGAHSGGVEDGEELDVDDCDA